MLILPGLPNQPASAWDRVKVHVDPHPLKADERGIILSSLAQVMRVVESGSTTVQPRPSFALRPDPTEIRYATLLWERVHLPECWLETHLLVEDVKFLVDEGVLYNPITKIPRDVDPIEGVLIAREKMFRELEAASPGRWALGAGVAGVVTPQSALVENRGLLVRLHRMLPVPDSDVSLVDLLDFREKHAQERFELRGHIETVYKRILEAPDRPLAEVGGANEIARASNDIVQKLKIRGIKGSVGNLDLSISFDFSAAGINYLQTQSLSAAAVAGFGTSIAKSVTAGLKRKLVGNGPYSYVASYHRDLRWL